MDIDIGKKDVQEDIFSSSGNNLPKQETQDVMVDLYDSPQDHTCGQVIYARYIFCTYGLLQSQVSYIHKYILLG